MQKCRWCGSDTVKNGYSNKGLPYQIFKCKKCSKKTYIRLNVSPIQETMKVGISEQELRAKYDVTFKIKKAAEDLSGDIFYTEFEFMKLCEIQANSGFRHIIDSGLFDQFRGKAGGTIYWSNPQNISKLKNEGVLK